MRIMQSTIISFCCFFLLLVVSRTSCDIYKDKSMSVYLLIDKYEKNCHLILNWILRLHSARHLWHFGNENPDSKTSEEIIPKFEKRRAYWKQFFLPKMGGARVVERFLASKIVYALKFYPLYLRDFETKSRNELQQDKKRLGKDSITVFTRLSAHLK